MLNLRRAGRDRHIKQGVAEILGGFGAGLREQLSDDILDGLTAVGSAPPTQVPPRMSGLERTSAT